MVAGYGLGHIYVQAKITFSDTVAVLFDTAVPSFLFHPPSLLWEAFAPHVRVLASYVCSPPLIASPSTATAWREVFLGHVHRWRRHLGPLQRWVSELSGEAFSSALAGDPGRAAPDEGNTDRFPGALVAYAGVIFDGD
jgi:hypothetical protein